jgi:uncharacterized protein YciI
MKLADNLSRKSVWPAAVNMPSLPDDLGLAGTDAKPKNHGMLLRAAMFWILLLSGIVSLQAQETSTSLIPEENKPKENAREFEMKQGKETYTMKQYFFVLLLRGDNADKFSETELEELQAGHMANINKYYEAGKIVLAGPFGDDTEKRGIFIFDTESLDEAETILNDDPAIAAGRLKYEIHPWWGAKGTTLK